MYNILIVDDEPMVIHGLCRQIDWQLYTLELAGTAESAEKALSILKQKPIDILFTDICMPKMDGLKLISAAKQQNPYLRSVVISSYSEFDYVKKALLLGVENYLLKPIDQMELDRTLEKTIDNLNRERIDAMQNAPDSSAFKSNILDRWVNAAIQDYEFYERAEALAINLSARQYQVCVVDIIDFYTKGQKLPHLRLLLEKFRSSLGISFSGECFIDRFDRVVAVLCGTGLEKRQDELALLFDAIIAEAKGDNTEIFACFGPISEGMEYVPRDYSSAVEYLNFRFIDPDASYIFCDESLMEFNLLKCGPILAQFAHSLALEEDGKSGAAINNLFDVCTDVPIKTVKKCVIPFLVMIIKHVNVSGHTSEMLPSSATTGFAAFSSITSAQALHLWLLDVIAESFALMGTRKQSLHPLVQRTLDSIKQDYHTDLSLKTIAVLYKANPAYLGQIFREETGEYFNDYLMEVRLQASRILLLETDLKIREILCRIGMENQSYYNRAFKKAYGISPLEFRYQKDVFSI